MFYLSNCHKVGYMYMWRISHYASIKAQKWISYHILTTLIRCLTLVPPTMWRHNRHYTSGMHYCRLHPRIVYILYVYTHTHIYAGECLSTREHTRNHITDTASPVATIEILWWRHLWRRPRRQNKPDDKWGWTQMALRRNSGLGSDISSLFTVSRTAWSNYCRFVE